MKHLQSIAILDNSKEELLPDFAPDFPYIASCAELDKYAGMQVPWHWHRVVELFYIRSGTLEYTTPNGQFVFPAGSGGFVNSNVLHSSRIRRSGEETVQLLHLFDPSFLAGEHGSRIEAKYILPLTTASAVEIIPLHPENPEQAELLEDIKQAFSLSEQDWGYELKLRESLTNIWLKLFQLAGPVMNEKQTRGRTDDLIKMLMVYVHENYQHPISIEQLADSAHVSKRVCFRIFRDNLHMTPVEYIREYRLQKACQMLAKTNVSITEIASGCGLGSSSYFGKTFRERFGCTPAAYRKEWHNRNKIKQK